MKKLILLSSFTLVLTGLRAQVYEHIYEVTTQEVQSKIDENKMNGLPILSNVQASFNCGLAGLGINQKSNLIQQLSSIPSINSFNVADDGSSVNIVCSADFTIDQLKAILMNFNSTVINYTETYTVNN